MSIDLFAAENTYTRTHKSGVGAARYKTRKLHAPKRSSRRSRETARLTERDGKRERNEGDTDGQERIARGNCSRATISGQREDREVLVRRIIVNARRKRSR